MFINVKDEESAGGEILLGGTLFITEVVSFQVYCNVTETFFLSVLFRYKGEKKYVKWIVYQEPDSSTPDMDNTYTLDHGSSSVLHSPPQPR